ncbi:MAG: YciI family protein [Kineosporiaceae bacterium]|jgi:hypothetical protein
MTNFLLAYTGGSDMSEATPEQQQAVMAAWGAWFGSLGAGVVDGGNPFGASTSIAPDGSTGGPSRAGLTGYSILAADSMESAAALAKGCPLLDAGGSIEVYEVVPAM